MVMLMVQLTLSMPAQRRGGTSTRRKIIRSSRDKDRYLAVARVRESAAGKVGLAQQGSVRKANH